MWFVYTFPFRIIQFCMSFAESSVKFAKWNDRPFTPLIVHAVSGCTWVYTKIHSEPLEISESQKAPLRKINAKTKITSHLRVGSRVSFTDLGHIDSSAVIGQDWKQRLAIPKRFDHWRESVASLKKRCIHSACWRPIIKMQSIFRNDFSYLATEIRTENWL